MQTVLDYYIQQAGKNYTGQIKRLLLEAHLPIADLGDELPNFLIALTGDQVIGCVGLEIVGKEALLRSFAVDKDLRNQHIGNHLYEAVIEIAEAKSITSIFLITTTAEKYFEKQGFKKINRSDAPASIAQTQQFSAICASSGIVMRKEMEVL